MIIGKLLLSRTNVSLSQLTHKNFEPVKNYFETNKDTLFNDANIILVNALNSLYKEDYKNLNMERLSAAFRRGDLYGQINFQ